jgi:hypothetical protein
MNRRILRVLLGTALLTGASSAAAHPTLVGGFRPVASERSARALWVNPAAIGVSGQGTASLELLLDGDQASALLQSASDEEWELPTEIRGFSVAAATDRLAYGFQRESDDVAGVPDWTLAVGNGVQLGAGGRAGLTAEWRGGDDSGFDADAGLQFPVGRQLQVAAVLHDLLAADVDGVESRRTWQVGAAAPFRSILGTFTWDAVLVRSRTTVHWLGFAIDRSRYAHLSVARSTEGDWAASFALTFPHYLFGVGGVDRDGGARPDHGHVSADWSGRPYPGTADGR